MYFLPLSQFQACISTRVRFANEVFSRSSLLTTFRAIHKAGVIHRDIGLRNLCATTAGEASVIDFSHAKLSTNRKDQAAEIVALRKLLGIAESKGGPSKRVKSEANETHLRRSERLKQRQDKNEIERGEPLATGKAKSRRRR